jgi:hypothetical protein
MAGLGFVLGGWIASLPAGDVNWHAAGPAPSNAPLAPAVSLAQPVSALSAPVTAGSRNPDGFPVAPAAVVASSQPAGSTKFIPNGPVVPASYPQAIAVSAGPADASSGLQLVQGVDSPPPSPPAGSTISPLPPLPPPPPPPPGGADVGAPPGSDGMGFFAKCKEKINLDCGTWCGSNRTWFQSDHCFDQFISPVSDPFLAEDPRALTEFRPIFMYQRIPASTPNVNGGNVEFLGFQGRLAVTERLSVVMSELGAVWLNPHETGELHSGSGLSELRIGPKYTFVRDETDNTLVAAGLTFDIPIGSASAYQNTQTLSLAPYLSVGHTFGRSSYGSFNTIGNVGYNISVDDKRSEFFYLTTHLDYDILGMHKIYPLIELNYLHYATSGNGPTFNFEGGDLFNFGSQGVSGTNDLTLALGARYKFCEWAQLGGAVEFPLVGSKDLNVFRLTLDFILRY